MSSDHRKRYTQFDFGMLAGLGPQPKTALRGQLTKQEDSSVDHTIPDRDAVKPSVNKIVRFLDGDTVVPTTGLMRLGLVEAVNSGVRAHEYITRKAESPWRSYEKIYQLRLGVGLDGVGLDRVVVAQRRSPPFNLVTVRRFVGPAVEDKFHMLQRIQHAGAPSLRSCAASNEHELRGNASFVSALGAFEVEKSLYVVFEHMPISLHYIAGNPYINELRLAAILGQILEGLAFLAMEGLEHGSLTCSNILVNADGEVKISDQECCCDHIAENAEPRDIRALAPITNLLMQGYLKDDGAIGVDDLDRWPRGSDALGFLSETTSATSVDELMKHRLLRLPWRKEMLRGLVSLAILWAHWDYKYTPS